MEEVIDSYGQILREKVLAADPELVEQKGEFALAQIHPVAEMVMRWRFGLGCLPLSRQHVAERLKVTPEQMEQLEEAALLDFGFAFAALFEPEDAASAGEWSEAA